MIRMVADNTPLAVLAHAGEPIELRDPTGVVLGHYTPVNAQRVAELSAQAVPLFDPAEMERRVEAREEGFTTREVFQRLLSLTTDPNVRAHLHELVNQQEG